MAVARMFVIIYIMSLTCCGYEYEYDGNEWNGAEDFQIPYSGNYESYTNPAYFHGPIIDPLTEDDHEEYDLADIITLSEAKVDFDIDTYNSAHRKEIVDIHNIYRSNFTKPIPKASDMEYQEYNNTLEMAAYAYLKKCKFAHVFSDKDNMTNQGQNIYSGPSMIPSRPLYLWYNEYRWYNFNNFTCQGSYPEYHCGHFTQMMWHNSHQVGCARRSYCFPLNLSKRLVSCHYYPGGNYVGPGFQVFRYGQPCTRCSLIDGNLCHKNLCVDKRICYQYTLSCECKTVCKNCARPNSKSCSCDKCKPGWDWEDCSYPCLNAVELVSPKTCYKAAKSAKAVCGSEIFTKMCRQLCGRCKLIENEKPTDLCCGGKICKPHYVLDEKTCQCKALCPSPLCLYSSSATDSFTLHINRTGIFGKKKGNNSLSVQMKVADSADKTAYEYLLLVLIIFLQITFL